MKDVIEVSQQQIDDYRKLGYNEDILPKGKDNREWSTFNYFTLWMGSVHNIPNYVAVGGFLFLGASPINIMFALLLSSFFVAALMVLNGAAGTKYGVPFSLLLRSSYGDKGALLPGLFRGVIAAIMWFGLQTFTGSLSIVILIGKIFPPNAGISILSSSVSDASFNNASGSSSESASIPQKLQLY